MVVLFMLVVLLLLLQDVCAVPITRCNISGALPENQKYYHSGDLNIAAIISQSYRLSSSVDFNRHPLHELIDDPM